jgi:hypothetical protein
LDKLRFEIEILQAKKAASEEAQPRKTDHTADDD